MPKKIVPVKVRKLNPHVLFILDESGSMTRYRDLTITGFNEQIQEVQSAENAGDSKVSLVTFSGSVRPKFFETKVKKLVPLDTETYVPHGGTALLDAMHYGITRLLYETRTAQTPSYLVIILTDGEENASQYVTADNVRKLVTQLQAMGNWTFAFMGGNDVDLNKVCKTTGITLNNSFKYDAKTAEGNLKRNNVMTRSIGSYMVDSASGVAASDNYFGSDRK